MPTRRARPKAPTPPASARSAPPNRLASSERLDARDLKILEIIQTNGRISKKALAKAIGLSLTPCFQRIVRLEKHGFICGYRGIIEPRLFGSFVWVFTEITLRRHRAVDFERFEQTVATLPEVLLCDAVSGGLDYILRIVVRDMSQYLHLLEDLVARGGVETYYSYIVTKRVRDSLSFPIAALTQPGEKPR